MPTYDYQCDACDHTFEEFQSFSEKPLKKCPVCGKRRLRRLIGSGAAVLFKGSGFYQTDYRSESYKKAAKAEQESSTASSGDKSGDGDKSGANGKKETSPTSSNSETSTKAGKSSKSES